MVVLSAAVCTKDGQVLLARQYKQISRLRLEGLLSSFSKLRSNDSQHTFIETESVRFVYQPLDELYVVLITNLQSNIILDLETLRLFAKLVPDYAGSTRPDDVRESAMQLSFAFDEVVTPYGGYAEKVTPQQIQTFLEMDSHDEKVQRMLLESKMSSARNEARRMAEQLEREKAEKRKLQSLSGGGAGGSGYNGYPGNAPRAYDSGYNSGGGGGGGGSGSGYGSPSAPLASPPPAYGSGSASGSSGKAYSPSASASASASDSFGLGGGGGGGARKKGMTLGKPQRKSDDFVQAIAKEEQVSEEAVAAAVAASIPVSATGGGSVPQEMVEGQTVRVSILERVEARLERDGEVLRFDVKGTMSLNVFDPRLQRLELHTAGINARDKGFRFQLSPKLDSRLFRNDGRLRQDKPGDSFPLGRENTTSLLSWRFSSQDETQLPFSLNFWPNVENGRSVCTAKFQQEREGLVLRNVQLFIPIAGGRGPHPDILQLEQGTEWSFEPNRGLLVWQIGEISDDHSSGTLEFSVPEREPDDFWPIQTAFESEQTYCPVELARVVVLAADGKPGDEVEFDCRRKLTVDSFQWE